MRAHNVPHTEEMDTVVGVLTAVEEWDHCYQNRENPGCHLSQINVLDFYKI